MKILHMVLKKDLGGKIMTEFSDLIDYGNSDKKAKGAKKCVITRRPKFNDYKNCLLDSEIILKS